MGDLLEAGRESIPPAPTGFCRRAGERERLKDVAKLTAIIEPVVTAMGFDLVRVQLGGGPNGLTLQVMAENPATGQLTLDQCAAISRALDLPLEESDPIAEEYSLEVSSPGIDRPLTRHGDWVRWAGHQAKLKLEPGVAGRKKLEGRIGALSDEAVDIEVAETGTFTIPFANIATAKLVLTPQLIAATKPLDTAGADEIVEHPAATNDNDEAED
jgi:ribosome maturation factor RimP